MRSRIRAAALGLGVVPLAFGVAVAMAANTGTSNAKPQLISCKTDVTIEIPKGATQLTPPVPAGSEYGSASCKKLLGSGAQGDKFTLDQSTGDTVGKLTWYFPTGSIHGSFDLTPLQGGFGGGFTAVSYTGVLKFTGGTGAFAGYTGTGSMTCSSPDSIHTHCANKLKLKP